jgi:hypothetical protein
MLPSEIIQVGPNPESGILPRRVILPLNSAADFHPHHLERATLQDFESQELPLFDLFSSAGSYCQ